MPLFIWWEQLLIISAKCSFIKITQAVVLLLLTYGLVGADWNAHLQWCYSTSCKYNVFNFSSRLWEESEEFSRFIMTMIWKLKCAELVGRIIPQLSLRLHPRMAPCRAPPVEVRGNQGKPSIHAVLVQYLISPLWDSEHFWIFFLLPGIHSYAHDYLKRCERLGAVALQYLFPFVEPCCVCMSVLVLYKSVATTKCCYEPQLPHVTEKICSNQGLCSIHVYTFLVLSLNNATKNSYYEVTVVSSRTSR